VLAAFAWIEQTRPSLFMREDFSAYFIVLIFHAWGMAFLVGGGMAVSLRVLGVAAASPLERFAGFYPVMRVGAALAIPSRIALLVGYPAKALTNWVFALKFVCLGGAAWLVWRMRVELFPLVEAARALPARARWMAGIALLLWVAGVCCGKLLLYTSHMLTVS